MLGSSLYIKYAYRQFFAGYESNSYNSDLDELHYDETKSFNTLKITIKFTLFIC